MEAGVVAVLQRIGNRDKLAVPHASFRIECRLLMVIGKKQIEMSLRIHVDDREVTIGGDLDLQLEAVGRIAWFAVVTNMVLRGLCVRDHGDAAGRATGSSGDADIDLHLRRGVVQGE